MYAIHSDIAKNRIYVTLEGFFKTEEMKACTDKTIQEVNKLKPGFDVIIDVTRFSAVGPEALQEVKRAQAYYKKSGVRYALRVVGSAQLVSSQMSRIGKESDFAPIPVETLAEAEKFLDNRK